MCSVFGEVTWNPTNSCTTFCVYCFFGPHTKYTQGEHTPVFFYSPISIEHQKRQKITYVSSFSMPRLQGAHHDGKVPKVWGPHRHLPVVVVVVSIGRAERPAAFVERCKPTAFLFVRTSSPRRSDHSSGRWKTTGVHHDDSNCGAVQSTSHNLSLPAFAASLSLSIARDEFFNAVSQRRRRYISVYR